MSSCLPGYLPGAVASGADPVRWSGLRNRNTTSRVSEHQLSMKNPILLDPIFCSPFLKRFIDDSSWNHNITLPILVTKSWARSWSRCTGSHPAGNLSHSSEGRLAAITFLQACGYLPSRPQSINPLWLYSFYRPTEGRRLSRPRWLVTYRNKVPRLRELNPDTATHSSTNRAQRRLTSVNLVDRDQVTNSLPLRQTAIFSRKAQKFILKINVF